VGVGQAITAGLFNSCSPDRACVTKLYGMSSLYVQGSPGVIFSLFIKYTFIERENSCVKFARFAPILDILF
jgi:hypothetical protein